MLIFIVILLVNLFNSKVNDLVSVKNRKISTAPFCAQKNLQQFKSNDLIIQGKPRRSIYSDKTIYVSIDGPTDESNFCALRRHYKSFRSRDHVEECKSNVGIKNLFEPITTYNISLIIFYDEYFSKRCLDIDKEIKYIVKGLQERFTTRDIINEIGLIKFYVVRIVGLVDQSDQLVDYQKIERILYDYMIRQHIKISNKIIPVWLTGANIVTVLDGVINYAEGRIEGVSNANSFCRDNSVVIISCNSVNKAQITLSHEIAHTFGAEHDINTGLNPCKCDADTFLMSSYYSIHRSVFSACSIDKIAKNFKALPARCFRKESEYEFGYEDVTRLEPLSLDVQCAQSYSRNFKSNQRSINDPRFCENLVCKHSFIEFSHDPVMNGTPCHQNPKMVCCFGKCVLNCSIFHL